MQQLGNLMVSLITNMRGPPNTRPLSGPESLPSALKKTAQTGPSDTIDRKLEGFSQSRSGPRDAKGKSTKSFQTAPGQAPVEDEYILNLQRQIYFLELEIKLLKDQDRERGNMFGGQGETGPLTENFWALKNKYSAMQKELEGRIGELSGENKDLVTRAQTLQMNLERANRERADMEDRLRKATAAFDEESEKYRRALNSASTQREEALKKQAEFGKERDLAKTWASELRIKFERQKLQLEQLQEKMAQMEEYKNKMIEEKNKQIVDLQDSVQRHKEDMANNTTMKTMELQVKEMTQRNNELLMERDNMVNKIRALEYSKDIVDKACAQLNAEKRAIVGQLEETKAELDKERLFQEANLNKRLKERERRELYAANQQIEDSRKEANYHMDQFKVKVTENMSLIEERNNLKFELEEVRQKMEQLMQDHQNLLGTFRGMEGDFKEALFKLRQFEDRNQKLDSQCGKAVDEAQSLFAENAELRAKVNYMTKKLELNDQLKNIDLEELRLISKSSLQANDTINQFISKWGEVQTFQKS